MTIVDFINVLAVLALLGLFGGLIFLGADTVGEVRSWTPPPVEDTPGFRVIPRRPYDFESEAP